MDEPVDRTRLRSITPNDVQQAAARLSAGEPHKFGPARDYEAIVNGMAYAPKALVGLAAERIFERPLAPKEFSGGEQAGQANGILRSLGFEVRSIRTATGEDWTDDEIAATVESYFHMLAMQLRGERYVKAAMLRVVATHTLGRSVKSVEYKCQNISAVLRDAGWPWLEGFAPAANYQRRLGEVVLEFVGSQPPGVEAVLAAIDEVQKVPAAAPSDVIDAVAPSFSAAIRPANPRPMPRRMNLAERDASNRRLGDAGEKFVVDLERRRLTDAGRADLAGRVRWVAKDDGDGAGFDVASFNADGSALMVEVKTTNSGKSAPFFLTANEVAVSALQPEAFRLYRVYQFSAGPRLFIVSGDLQRAMPMTPIAFVVRPE